MADTRLRTSFVPKKTLVPTADTNIRASINIFLAGGLIIFFLTLAVAGGVYLYSVWLDAKIREDVDALKKAEDAFEPSLILDVKRLDGRMIAANQILNEHVSITPILDMLSTATLQSVRFTDFKYVGKNTGGGAISMNGEAQSYMTVAGQADSFAEETIAKNVSFSNLTLNETGGVKFSVSMDIDPASILYRAKYSEQVSAPIE